MTYCNLSISMHTVTDKFVLLFDYVYRHLCEISHNEQIIFILMICLPIINIIFILRVYTLEVKNHQNMFMKSYCNCIIH